MQQRSYPIVGFAFGIFLSATSLVWAESSNPPSTYGGNGQSLKSQGTWQPLLSQHLAANPGVTAPLVPPGAATSDPKSSTPKSREDVLDDLFHRLASANDADEASGVALVIQHIWLQSGSDTADLLMSRAVTAAEKGDRSLAIHLLDQIVQLDPDWAEAWNKRATLRFIENDDNGSMADIGHVLKLEPRHFGALTGMASILLRNGMKKGALGLLRKAAAIYPHNGDVDKMIDQLVPEVEGRGI